MIKLLLRTTFRCHQACLWKREFFADASHAFGLLKRPDLAAELHTTKSSLSFRAHRYPAQIQKQQRTHARRAVYIITGDEELHLATNQTPTVSQLCQDEQNVGARSDSFSTRLLWLEV